ncbi:hypothetical protein PHMEG_00036225 [Phytophthora megakarya]|uniref:Uncharacterized protein n=1 Tax=Phytophthora megakarya TaxID=4795 RepID=A0A225UMD0_9STRA|nr:hypothetical protein PHMEG_00036225 [Phytophthora megakarya]
MSKPSNSSLTAMLKFSGEQGCFATWKNQILVHLASRSSERAVEELKACRERPTIRFQHSLTGMSTVTPTKVDATEKEKDSYELQLAFLDQQESYIKDLLSQTLPTSYKLNEKVQQPVHLIWRDVEKRFGLNTVAGVVGLVQQFDEAVNVDFKSFIHPFARLKILKDQVNRNSSEALKTGVILSNLLMIKVLGVLPNHLWGQAITVLSGEFTPDRVEPKLCAIFGSKSKGEIMALGSARPVNHVHTGNNKLKQPVLGKHNTGPHKFVDCPKRARDLVAGVKRRDIHAYPSGKQGVNAVKKELQGLNKRVKAQAKNPKREATLEVCKAKMAVDACSAMQKDVPLTPSGYASPPPVTWRYQ